MPLSVGSRKHITYQFGIKVKVCCICFSCVYQPYFNVNNGFLQTLSLSTVKCSSFFYILEFPHEFDHVYDILKYNFY